MTQRLNCFTNCLVTHTVHVEELLILPPVVMIVPLLCIHFMISDVHTKIISNELANCVGIWLMS